MSIHEAAIKERPILFSADLRWIKIAAKRIGVDPVYYASELNSGRKCCGGCGNSYPRTTEFFGGDSKTFDKLRSRCRTCVRKSKKRHYTDNRDQHRARQLKYQRENRDRLYAYNARWNRERNAKIRAEMIDAYGGQCSCCGEDEPLFLELDHIFNDGAEDRRVHGNQFQILLALKDRGWPKERFQLLCSNCNQGKRRNGGVCPHKCK